MADGGLLSVAGSDPSGEDLAAGGVPTLAPSYPGLTSIATAAGEGPLGGCCQVLGVLTHGI